MAKCECYARMEGECVCGAWSGERDYYEEGPLDASNDFTGVNASVDRFHAAHRLATLGANLESAASMAAMHRIGYTRGFEAGRTLAAFCEDYVVEPYLPLGDTRPTAERLGWRTA